MRKLLSVFLCVFAMSLCSKAGIFSSKDEDICKKANKYRMKGDMALAFENYMIAARMGNAEAMAWVGAMYYAGGVCEQSYEEAFNWSLKAADAGDAMSFYTLGDYFYKGIGVKKDRVKAMNMWSIAAEKKVPCAIQQMNKISPAGKKAYEEYMFLDTLEETLKNMKDPKDSRVENKEGSKDVCIFTHTNMSEINYECVLNFSEHKRTGVKGLVSVKILGKLATDEGVNGTSNKNGLEFFRTVIGKKYGESSDVSDFPILKKLIPNLTDMVFWEGEYQLVVLGVDKQNLRPTIIISPLLAAIAYERDSAVKESQNGF